MMDSDPLSDLGAQQQPAATLAVDASKEHGRDHAQSPLTWPFVELVTDGTPSSLRFISTNTVVVARNRSPRKFLNIFISRIGSGAACFAENGNCAHHHIVDIGKFL